VHGKVEASLVGEDDGSTARLVRGAGLGGLVQVTGYLPHDQSLRWVRWADCLFLPLHGVGAGCRSRIVPGKTYEYLASGKPILGALPEGDARDLVAASGRGYLADPCDPTMIADALSAAYETVLGSTSHQPPLSWVNEYRRSVLTRKMYKFIDQVCQKKHAVNENEVHEKQ